MGYLSPRRGGGLQRLPGHLPWADDSLYWACDAGVLPWSPGGRLDPSGTLTQAQTADIFSAFARQGRPG
ncbi:MAG: hypothetical protein ACLTNE_17140 [Intestinimonas butyriciproducens]|uniref:hypothetical protein n=1 Tax=Intestinimonas butyriciproducens TaxID=1297617 RepID=UPI0039951D46